MSSVRDFLRRHNNKDVVPILEEMKKKMVFYPDKDIDMLKIVCTLPNLTNISLHKSAVTKIFHFTDVDKEVLEKNREDVVGGPSTKDFYT